jgi:lysophospholipase L1-like esterase
MKHTPLLQIGFDPLGRRSALQGLAAWAAVAAGLPLTACGGSDAAAPAPAPPASQPPPPSPPPALSNPVTRLKAALLKPVNTVAAVPVSVAQGAGNALVSSFGSTAQVFPPPGGPSGSNLATVPQFWGWQRERWRVAATGAATIAGQAVYPVTRSHSGATLGSEGVCGLHFAMEGRAFEVLFAGVPSSLTVVVDGQYAAAGVIDTTLTAGVPGAPLAQPNTFTRVDFGSSATRRVSLYARSTQGLCALAFAADDRVAPWDRSDQASAAFMADSYGGAPGPQWGISGPFWEAAALLGIAHLDLNAIGGTGYAPNSAPGFTNPGDAFAGRLADTVDALPDLFVTAGGINDNNTLALPPYASAEAARLGFEAATAAYYLQLRAALPQSVLVALAPWAPRAAVPADAPTLAKADAILAALRAAGGPWVFVDNLRGGWSCSSGASATAAASGGPWQTGTGNSAAPRGDGNGDLYLKADGVHPNAAGSRYLGERLAADLRLALQSL